MEIILKQTIDKLGYKDDLVYVKDGYGRNFLIPQGKAILATAAVKKMHEETLKQRSFREEKLKSEAQKAVEALKGTPITVGAKAGDGGKIFGSVTALQVVDALKKLGYEVDRKGVTIKGDTIKNLGSYEAEVRFHREVVETIPFQVVEE